MSSRGVLRFFVAPFLAVWLVLWSAVEALVISSTGFLLWPERIARWGFPPIRLPPGPFTALWVIFLLFWFAFWTAGGVVALYLWLRLLWGRDEVRIEAGQLSLLRRAWPFRRRVTLPLREIVQFEVARSGGRLVASTLRATVLLSDLGNLQDRHQACATLMEWTKGLRPTGSGTEPPAGWQAARAEDGRVVLLREPHPTARGVMGLIVAAPSIAILRGMLGSDWRDFPRIAATMLLCHLLWLAAGWIAFARERWFVSHGALERERIFLSRRFLRSFRSPELRLRSHRGSKGNRSFTLEIHDAAGGGSTTLDSQINSSDQLERLARWLTAQTGIALRTE